MFEFVIQSVLSEYRIDTAAGRRESALPRAPHDAMLADAPLQREYARRLAGWVGWPNPEEVLQQVQQEARR